jgi:SAM-dependent methyltransferase
MLGAFHRLQETARGYRFTQLLGRPTIQRYQSLVAAHVPQDAKRRVLEIGCGVGSSRPLFEGDYTGIDINPDYIQRAQATLTGRFMVMDAAQMPFAEGSFDDAVSIATGHHLSDEQLGDMVRQATRAARCLHVIDAILPVSPRDWFKWALFRADRGKHVRTFEQLFAIVGRNARIEFHEIREGPLHDVGYIRAARRDA